MAKIQDKYFVSNDPETVYDMQLKARIHIFYNDLEHHVSIYDNEIIGISHGYMFPDENDRFKKFTKTEMVNFIKENMLKTDQKDFKIYDMHKTCPQNLAEKIVSRDSDKYDWIKIINLVKKKGNNIILRETDHGIRTNNYQIISINGKNYDIAVDSLGHNLNNQTVENHLLKLYEES